MRHERAALLVAGAAGFASTTGQVLAVREALVLWSGFELAAGLILASWLLFAGLAAAAGGALPRRSDRGRRVLAFGAPLLSLALPATLLLLRAVRPIADLGPGELPGLGVLLAAGLAAPAPAAAASGLLYAAAWSEASAGEASRPIRVYLLEAFGAAAGGLLLAFVLLPGAGALRGCLLASLAPLAAGLLCIECVDKKRLAAAAWLACAGLLAVGLYAAGPLDRASRVWQWGRDAVRIEDTPYQNLALLSREGQLSLFANGAWAFSLPDPRTSEPAAHTPMLEHPDPKNVLLLMGDPFGLPPEILKHPSVERLDCVLLDAAVLRIAPDRLAGDPRLFVHVEDPAVFVRSTGRRYDVILLGGGDPVSMEASRLYSVEFFQDLKKRLARGGVLAFSISGPSRGPGPIKLAQLKALSDTLRLAFPKVLVLPGDNALFLAGGQAARLSADAGLLADRLARRGLALDYVRPDSLQDLMSPFARRYLDQVLEQPSGQPSTLLHPWAFLHALTLQAQAASPRAAALLQQLMQTPRRIFRLGAGVLAFGLAVFAMAAPTGARPAAVATATAGGGLMVFELALLAGCQAALGSLYSRLALLVGAFMAGLAVGAAAVSVLGRRRPNVRLWAIHLALCLGLLGLAAGLPGLVRASAPGWTFYLLALLGGCLGGGHYAASVASLARGRAPGPGAGLYALDLAGAMVMAVASSLAVMPLYGVQEALFVQAALCLSAVPGLTLRLYPGR
ncbi:MAG: spermidine synthase [Desulfovibrionales bacterium]|nr:spermidine synthase [Desulfovibrionales bacterium]